MNSVIEVKMTFLPFGQGHVETRVTNSDLIPEKRPEPIYKVPQTTDIEAYEICFGEDSHDSMGQ